MTTPDSDLAFAQQLAHAAAAVSLSYFRRELKRWTKDDGSLATEADLAVEDKIRGMVAHERPGDAMLGEERGETGSGARRWIVDGIDGTIEFAAGSPDWATLIALEVDGRVVVSVCDQPAQKRRYWAARGHGAFCLNKSSPAPRRLSVTHTADLRVARSHVPPPEWVPNECARNMVAALNHATRPEIPVDHSALQVASGGSELAVFFRCGAWDIAAPSLIVEEAGGRFTNLVGNYDFASGSALFSNGRVHDDVLRLLASTDSL